MIRSIKNLSLQMKILLIVLTAALVGCLVMMTVSPARAKLEFFSPDYVAEIQQTHIGVQLTEKTGDEADFRVVSGDDQLIQQQDKLLGEDAQVGLQFDKVYPEALSVKNASNDMDEYVRLTVRKYWATPAPVAEISGTAGVDTTPATAAAADVAAAAEAADATAAAETSDVPSADGDLSDAMKKAEELSNTPSKDIALNPAHIQLAYDAANEGDWVFSAEESTDERLVFYYKHLLRAGEQAATPAITGISVSSSLRDDPAAANGAYTNCYLGLAAQVDSVQVNNAPDAAKSAWGIDVTQFGQYGLDWTSGK